MARRIGLAPIHQWSPPASQATAAPPGSVPIPGRGGAFAALDNENSAIVIGPDVLVDARTILAFAAEAARDDGGRPVVYREQRPLLLFVPPGGADAIRACSSLDEAVETFARSGRLRDAALAGHFCRSVADPSAVAAHERDFVGHMNGGARESFFTKIIRRFSVPISIRLARMGARPAHVTLGGLALASLSAWCIAQGSYMTGVVGGVLYYSSMVLDCSDGEVARLTVRDSSAGAWLETIVDYTTYLLLLGALMVRVRHEGAAEEYRLAAMVALAGSILVLVVAAYLRRRVASADPEQFDRSSADALRSASALHRFARWGRQWIKRSTLAHLVLALALVNQLPMLLYLWALGAAVASAVILLVAPFVVRRVTVRALDVHDVGAR
jgi:phosphatidylglycerophosphate synthase